MGGRIGPLAFLLLFITLPGCDRGKPVSQWEFETMGTLGRVKIYHTDPAVVGKGTRAAKAVFDSVEAVMSTWDPDSEISQLNQAESGLELPLSLWLNECLSSAEDIKDASGGAFDPTAEPLMRLWGFYRRKAELPGEAEIDSARALMGRYRYDREAGTIIKGDPRTAFDLGGIAKGYALDRAFHAMRLAGVRHALLDLGGNLICMGAPPGREEWRVGIRDPQDKGEIFAVVLTTDIAVATSGSYERFVTINGRRYGHIMDPSTGRPAEGLLSVTVLTSSATLADGLSTALFVLGLERGRELIDKSFQQVEFVFVTLPEGSGLPRVVASAGLEDRFFLLPEKKADYTVEFVKPRRRGKQL